MRARSRDNKKCKEKHLRCLGDLLGMFLTTQLCGDYFIRNEIRIPSLNNQDSIESKEPDFFRGSCGRKRLQGWVGHEDGLLTR